MWRSLSGRRAPTARPFPAPLGAAQPERHAGRLHRFVDDFDQPAAQRRQVDLIAQVGAEGGDDLGGVVLAAIEAPVDEAPGCDGAAD